MSEDEQRQIKANLLLDIHDNEVLLGCINAKIDKFQKVFERLSWALKTAGKIDVRDYPTKESVVALIQERTQAIEESERLNNRAREMGLRGRSVDQ